MGHTSVPGKTSILSSHKKVFPPSETEYIFNNHEKKKITLVSLTRPQDRYYKNRNMSEDGESFLDGMSGIQSMGIINALRTGDPALDMVLAMALPFLLKLLFQLFTEMTEYLRSLGLWTQRQRAVYERIIVHKSTVNRWGSSNSTDGDSQNTILIKAIRLYLHKVVKLTLQDAEVDLTTLEDKQSSLGYRSYYDDDDDDDDSKTVVGALSKYDIVHKPRPNKFYKVGEYGKLNPATVSLIIEHNEEEKGERSPPIPASFINVDCNQHRVKPWTNLSTRPIAGTWTSYAAGRTMHGISTNSSHLPESERKILTMETNRQAGVFTRGIDCQTRKRSTHYSSRRKKAFSD